MENTVEMLWDYTNRADNSLHQAVRGHFGRIQRAARSPTLEMIYLVVIIIFHVRVVFPHSLSPTPRLLSFANLI